MSEVKGFHKANCIECKRPTWHYKEQGHAQPICTNHSNWNPQIRKPVRVSGHTIVTAHLTKPHNPVPSERELAIANKLDRGLWKKAEAPSQAVELGDWANALFEPPQDAPVRDPNKTYCTFCGDPVEQIHLHTEKKARIRYSIDGYKDSDGTVHIQEKTVAQVETVHACRNCCLKVRRPVVVHRI